MKRAPLALWAAPLVLMMLVAGGCELVASDGSVKNFGVDSDRIDNPGRDAGPCDLCGGDCVDVNFDSNHCGGCWEQCADGLQCLEGVCAESTCRPGTSYCSGGCVDLQDSAQNCGRCAERCTSGVCIEGRCSADLGGTPYRFQSQSAETVRIPASSDTCPSGSRVEGLLSAVNTPLGSAGGADVRSFEIDYWMDRFIGEPTRLARYSWSGSGNLGSVVWVADVVEPDTGAQYLADAGRVYASWSGGNLRGPDEGFGTDATGSPNWNRVFVSVSDGGIIENISEEEARSIYGNCFELAHLQVLMLDSEPALVVEVEEL